MLNEVLMLERALADYGFESETRHADVSQLLKGDVLRVRLAGDGSIDALERLDGKTRPDIWTLRDGKHNGFPGLKTARGLLRLSAAERADHDDRWQKAKTAKAKRAEIEHLIAAVAPDPEASGWLKPSHRKRIAERLGALRALQASPETAAVPAVFERFLQMMEAAAQAGVPFPHRLLDALLDRVRHGDDNWLPLIRTALVDAVPIAFDVSGYARDAGDARQVVAVSRALSDHEEGAADGAEGICALTGKLGRLLEGNFPQPTLPSLGQTYLFSRNTDIRALARYGRNGPGSMPIGAELAGRCSGALTEVTKAERFNKMWRLLPAEAGDAQDLFISFVASAPDEEVARSLLEADEDDDDPRPGPAQVQQAAARIVEFWNGIAVRARPHERARIMILRTVDPGNRKAAYDKSPSITALQDAAIEWSAAMQNAPHWLTWPVFDKKTRASRCGRPLPQRPLSLVALSRKLFVRSGREALDAPGISGAEALALFMNEGDRPRRARRILRLLLERHTGLLTGLANAKLRGQLKDFDPKAVVREDALRSAAWMGALIAFIDPKRKNYMEDTGFKLGQLLSAADAVHAGYCAEVRGGQMPPTLVGNSVFAAAGRNPDRALEVLQTRWKPYHAWVDRVRKEYGLKSRNENDIEAAKPKDGTAWAVIDAVIKAKAAMLLCRELQPILARMREDKRAPDEAFRAELLLGYVAGVPDQKRNKSTPQAQGNEE